MALLAGTNYDPAGAVSKATTALTAMTALDTTNLRLSFVCPTSGTVMVRMRGAVTGATTFPAIQLGVLDGATVRLRMTPMPGGQVLLATTLASQEIVGCVTGLTPGTTYTWDAAMSVDATVGSTNLKYGGANDNSGADAFGGFVFEVWEAANLLAGIAYDPATAVTLANTSLLAMTAMDTTNLRNVITAPASGRVMWRVRVQNHGSTTWGQYLIGVMESSSVVARVAPIMGGIGASASLTRQVLEASGVITGLTAGSSHTYDAAYAVQVVGAASTGIKYGGPNDTTTNNAWGAAIFEIWAA